MSTEPDHRTLAERMEDIDARILTGKQRIADATDRFVESMARPRAQTDGAAVPPPDARPPSDDVARKMGLTPRADHLERVRGDELAACAGNPAHALSTGGGVLVGAGGDDVLDGVGVLSHLTESRLLLGAQNLFTAMKRFPIGAPSGFDGEQRADPHLDAALGGGHPGAPLRGGEAT